MVPENIHTPRKVTGNSEGEGGLNPEGVEGVHGQLLFHRVKKHEKNEKQHTIDPKHEVNVL